MIKNAGGWVVADRLGSIGHSYPYGQEKPSATQNGTEKFTGYLRDAETGLDYAVNRYHNPGTGRFLTPDSYRRSAHAINPGTWNRYSYALGDPINEVDRNGKDAFGSCGDDDDCAGLEGAGACAWWCFDSNDAYDIGYTETDTTSTGDGADDQGSSRDTDAGSSVNFTSSQIIGYDSDGNPIIGGTSPQVITVNDNGISVTVTFDSSNCPSGQVLINGACDIPIYGWLGGGQQVFVGVATDAGEMNNPCTAMLFYGASAGAATTATVDATAAVAGFEAHGIPATKWLAALYALSPNAVVNGLRRGLNLVSDICDAAGRQPGRR